VRAEKAIQGIAFDALRMNLNFKWVTGLVCLLIFVAAVDTTWDPPAIKPPSSHGASISALHIGGTFSLLEKEWYGAIGSPRRFQSDRFGMRSALEHRPARVSPLPRVRDAADTSPPHFPLAEG
jgi:hypothetical protein